LKLLPELSIDEATHSRLFGHYARVLVDDDMSDTLFETVLVEREGYAFSVNVEYERRPAYCPHCKMIAHSIQSCNRFKYANSQVTLGKQPKHTTQKPHSHHQNATVDKVFKRAAFELKSLQSKLQIVVPPFGTNSQGTFKEVEVSLLHP